MTVNAKTLQEFFRLNDAASAAVGAEAATNNREELAKAAAAFQAGATGQGISTTPANDSAQQKYVLNSYVAAYNAWNKKMVDMKVQKSANKISVKFHDFILKGQEIVANNEKSSVSTTPMADPDAQRESRAGTTPVKADNHSWSINAGTSIIEVINMVMLSSAYMRDQTVNTGQEKRKDGKADTPTGPTNWWKVVPSVTITAYDDSTSVYTFDITYFVMPYRHMNTTHPNLPVAAPDKSYSAKIYNYIYSGDNRSVLDFNLEFNYLYFTKVSTIGFDKSTDSPQRDEGANPPPTSGNASTTGTGIGASPKVYVASDSASAGKNLAKDRTAQALASAADSVYSNAVGEMIKAQLKIIGDPMWIKQDEIYVDAKKWVYSSTQKNGSDGVSSPYPPDPNDSTNGSLIMDAGDVVCWVDVKVPTDIDDATGGIRNSDQSVFTGAYRALEVTSNFSRGIFTQTLELVRYLNQPADKENSVSGSQRIGALSDTERGLLNDSAVKSAALSGSYGIVGYGSVNNNTDQA
jgi:hypothetical protein